MGIAGNMCNILQSTSPGSDPEPGDTPANDPASYSITTVQNYVTANPSTTLAALTAEEARGGSARATLVTWLHARFATGATAGTPATWTPSGKLLPASVAALIAGTPNTVVASPTTIWGDGEYAQTATAGAPGRAFWNGTAWEAGVGPASVATAGIPATWAPTGRALPATVADLIAGVPSVVTASPTSLWTVGQYLQTATAGAPGRAHWNGTAWVAGPAPA